MKHGVWVLGGGGHAKVVIASLESAGGSVAGIYDDDAAKAGDRLLGHEVLGPTPGAEWWEGTKRPAIIAIGDNAIREKVAALPGEWAVARHASAIVHGSVSIGPGSLVCAGVVIQPDSRIGDHVIVNTSCSIDHDCKIGNFAHIAPGARLAGGVAIGSRAFVGAGATVIQGITVGADATVAAGAVVIRDVAPGETVAGVPAQTLGRK